MKDRWVYGLSPREVKGDGDALVCVYDNSIFIGPKHRIICCQIKHLEEMFAFAKEREHAFGLGLQMQDVPELVDGSEWMSTIAELKPDMWRKNGSGGWEVTLQEGVTKENFAECCKAYNRHKGLRCELDEG